MLLIVAAVVVALLAVILILGATKPKSFRVERQASIQAPPDRVFPLISDFHRWGAWSPWEKLDPAMQRTFSGADSGKGAKYAWSGNSKAGAGGMEILEATPSSKVKIKLDFIKPFEGHNIAEFSLEPRGNSTNVKWAMYGPSAYMMRVMSVFCSMDKLLGKEFDTGLANMKSVAEKQTATAAQYN